jgi:hypothetical protein
MNQMNEPTEAGAPPERLHHPLKDFACGGQRARECADSTGEAAARRACAYWQRVTITLPGEVAGV